MSATITPTIMGGKTEIMVSEIAKRHTKVLLFVSKRDTSTRIAEALDYEGVDVVRVADGDLETALTEFKQIPSGVLIVSKSLSTGWRTKADATVYAECSLRLNSPGFLQLQERNAADPQPYLINCEVDF